MDENALIVDGLCAKQGKFELHDISFTLPKGYIMGLVGRMGSGKTTLLKNILNPALIKSGSVRYDAQAGFIMEDAPFFIEATLKENMEVFKNLYKNYDEREFYDRLRSVGLEEHKEYGLLSQSSSSRSAVQQAIIDCSDYIKMVQKARKIKVFRAFAISKRADMV